MESITFRDGRYKEKRYMKVTKILFENDKVCLCEAAFEILEPLKIGYAVVGVEDEKHIILFNKTGGEVLTLNFPDWYAEWYEDTVK